MPEAKDIYVYTCVATKDILKSNKAKIVLDEFDPLDGVKSALAPIALIFASALGGSRVQTLYLSSLNSAIQELNNLPNGIGITGSASCKLAKPISGDFLMHEDVTYREILNHFSALGYEDEVNPIQVNSYNHNVFLSNNYEIVYLISDQDINEVDSITEGMFVSHHSEIEPGIVFYENFLNEFQNKMSMVSDVNFNGLHSTSYMSRCLKEIAEDILEELESRYSEPGDNQTKFMMKYFILQKFKALEADFLDHIYSKVTGDEEPFPIMNEEEVDLASQEILWWIKNEKGPYYFNLDKLKEDFFEIYDNTLFTADMEETLTKLTEALASYKGDKGFIKLAEKRLLKLKNNLSSYNVETFYDELQTIVDTLEYNEEAHYKELTFFSDLRKKNSQVAEILEQSKQILGNFADTIKTELPVTYEKVTADITIIDNIQRIYP